MGVRALLGVGESEGTGFPGLGAALTAPALPQL